MSELELNKKVVVKLLQAFGSSDTETVKSLITDDIVAVTTGTCVASGTRGYNEVIGFPEIFKKFTKTGLRFEAENLTAEDNRVAAQMKGYAELINGMSYNNEYHFLFFLRDGKVYKFVEYLDTLLTEKTMGPLFVNG